MNGLGGGTRDCVVAVKGRFNGARAAVLLRGRVAFKRGALTLISDKAAALRGLRFLGGENSTLF